MYQAQFSATDDAAWGQAIELIDATTNLALADAADASFALEVKDCGSAVLTASTDAGTIEKPEDNILQWVFTASQMAGLCAGKTYSVGLTMTTAPGVHQLLVGSLAVIDGGF